MSVAVLEIHPARGRERRLHRGVVIGRARGCGVTLDDPLVSRRHARVVRAGHFTAIEDLGSANGLYINGRRARGVTPLRPRDVIQLGGTVWLVLRRRDGQLVGASEREPTA